MTQNELETLRLLETTLSTDKDEEYSIPLDISDIISICREFNNLGWQTQQQVEQILEVGVEEAIKNGNINKDALPKIKCFLKSICNNPYFGDAISQAKECIYLIQDYEEKHKLKYLSKLN